MIGSFRRFIVYFNNFKDLSKETWLLLVISFLSSISMGVTMVIELLFLNSLSYSSSSIGLILGATSISSTLFMFVGGILADYYGRRKMLILSTVANVAFLTIFGASSDFIIFTIASLLNGFSSGIFNASFIALLTDKIEAEKRGHIFSLSAFFFNLAIIIGNLSVGFVDVFENVFQMSPITSYRILFFGGAVLSTVSIIPLLHITEKASYSTKEKLTMNVSSWKTIKKFSIVNLFIGFGAGMFIPFISLYMSLRFDVLDALIGSAIALSNGIIAISFLVSPYVKERMGSVRTVVLTQGLSIVPLLLMSLPFDFNTFVVLYIIRAALMNMASPISIAYMMGTVEENERASISGITAAAWSGGSAISSVIAGNIMDVSLDLPIYLCSGFYLIATILFYLFFNKEDKIQI